MAILEKRRAVNQLPRFQRYQDTRAGDRAAALRGETPITSAIRQLAGSSGYGPMGESEGYLPMGGGMGGGRGGAGGVGGMGAGPMGGGAGGAGAMGGAGKGTVDKFGNMAGQPKNAVTSALKGSTAAGKTAGATTGKTTGTGATAGKVAGTTAAGTTSKLPGLTSKTAGTVGTAGGAGAKGLTSTGTGTAGAKTLTSTGTGTGKTTGATGGTGGTKSGSGLTSTLTNALTGAALGAGTKFVIDKLTGGTKTTGTGATTGASSGTGLKSNGSTIGSNIGKSIVDTGVKKIVDKTTGTVTGTAKDTSKTSGTGLTSKTSNTGLTSKTNPLGTNIGKKIVDNTGVTSVVKGTGTNVGTPPFVPKSGTGTTKTVGPKAPVTAGPKTTKGTGTKSTAGTKGAAGAAGAVKSATGVDDDETDDTTDTTVTGVAYDDEGNLMPGYELDEEGNPVWVGLGEDTLTGGEGDDTSDSGDDTDTSSDDEGTTTQVMDDGTVVTLDANGEIVSYTDTDGSTYDADGNEITEGGGDLDAGGNTTETLDDGTVITYDSSGDIVSYTDTDGVTYDGDGEVIDGSDTLVTGNEDIVEDEEDILSDEEEIVADEEETYDGLYSDDEGNLYDPDGNLVQYADGTMVGEEEEFTEGEVAFTDEYGNTYDYNGDLIAEADHSDFVQYDEDGNSYDWDGNLLEYAEGYGAEDEYAAEDEYTADDEYSSEDEYSYEDDYSYDDYDVKKGGLIHMQEGGDPSEGDDEEIEPIEEEENEDGTITQYFDDGSSITYDADGEVVDVTEATDEAEPAFATRSLSARDPNYSDTTEEVQDFQNVNYNFGESDDPTMTGYTLTGNRNPVGNAYSASSAVSDDATPPEGWPEGFVDNGDGTATYVDDDGSTVTIDADSNIVFVTDANGEVVAQDGQPTGPTGGLTQAGQGNRQYFDDGSSIETFDDGSQIVYDSDGNVFRSVDAYDTTYDDEGNAIVTDGFGNIVGVYDPQGNVIPLGGGRVTGPTQVTGAGGTGATDITRDPTIQDRIGENRANAASESAISDLLASLNTYGGAGAAGAVLGALLGNTDLFGGGSSGGGGGGFDMEGVGAINPRTTDFGIGPANYVGYDQYGTPEQMPELYGRELYQNLNAPGFNEVNPGDYARYDAEESGLDQFMEGDAEDQEMADEGYAEGMKDGGMPQGGLGQTAPQTYYTFGTPVDPLQNLRNPAPFQQQQQPQGQPQMPPQAAQNAQQSPPQQALPQMGMAPSQPSIPQGVPPAGVGMKSGGLPAWSNVPITQGRLNFRQGAAVHGAGDGQSDDIPAMLADGEYVIDAETVAQIGNGSTKAGAQALDKFRENIRAHKRSAPINKIPPKTKALTSYLKGAR